MRQRATIAAILGGIAVVFVLAVLVIGPGRHHPSPPSLQDHPNAAIQGELLYVDSNGCIVTTKASGASRDRIHCPSGPNPVQQVVWMEDGSIEYLRYDNAGPTWIRVDPQTKAETNVGASGGPSTGGWLVAPLNANDEYVEIRDGGEIWVGRTGALAKIRTFDVSDSSRPSMVAWSPDSQWMALQYVSPRSDEAEIWLLSRDGQTAGTLATNLQPTPALSWRIEGVGISSSPFGK